jgi:hypothetical protein
LYELTPQKSDEIVAAEVVKSYPEAQIFLIKITSDRIASVLKKCQCHIALGTEAKNSFFQIISM